MPTFFEIFSIRARAFFLMIGLVVSLGTPASATAPKAPTNFRIETSLNLVPGANSFERFYLFRWDDNSVDESGFRVEVRLGNTGAFETPFDSVSANNTSYFTALNLFEGAIVQFRVQAFKFNGAVIEYSASNIAEFTATKQLASLNTPTNLTVTQSSDGVYRFRWNESSTNEIYHHIFVRKTPNPDTAQTTGFAPLEGLFLFSITDVEVQHKLVPNTSYQFAVRATRRTDSVGTSPVPVNNIDTALSFPYVTVTTPPLATPSDLTSQISKQHDVILSWKDNSTNETSFKLEYKLPTESTWTTYSDQLEANRTSITISVGPGSTYDWRISALYAATGITTIVSTPSVHTSNIPFPKPIGLTATTSGVSGAVDLVWQDMSESESFFDIYTRVVGTQTWYYSKSMVANTTRATVTERIVQQDGSSVSVPLAIDSEHEFYVEARSSTNGLVSEKTNTASAFARHGFTSRTYQPAKVNVPFSYNLVVSNAISRMSWSVANLPNGLTFNADTGLISGTPLVAGAFSCPMTVNYSSGSATTPLNLRILRQDATPVVTKVIPNITLGTGTQFTIPLADKFNDPDSETAVKLRTTRGEIDLLLYPSLTPETVANFMGYVENKAYNGVIFHRSVPTFIVQGGAYVPIGSPKSFASLNKRPSPRNEPGISNVRGTVAAAKVGGSPDSATHDFFFNLEDNSLKTNIELDNQNGGFTAFARVAGSGMSVVDGIAGLPIGVYKNDNPENGTNEALDRRVILDGVRTPFEEVPMDVTGTSAPNTMNVNQTVQIISAAATPVLTYEVVENNSPTVVRASIVDNSLRLEGLAVGTPGAIKVRARDLDGNPVDQTFTVSVMAGHKPPVITRQPVAQAVLPGAKASFSVTATGTNLVYQWRRNQVPIENATGKTLSLTNVQEAITGDYDVLVGNSTTTLTSNSVRLDLRAQPVITQHPTGAVVELGKALVLQTTVTGAPVPTLVWLRGGKAVSGQKLATLNIPAVKLTDGGAYVLRASNVVNKKVDSNVANVIVVDKTLRLAATLPNKNAVLKAQVTGPVGLEFQWQRDGVALTQDTDRLTGTQTATLTVKNVSIAESNLYTCKVKMPDGSLPAETGAWRVTAVQRPTMNAFAATTAYVGINYEFTIPGGGPTNSSISSFSVSGLPPGLKLDTTTGLITGNPSRAGIFTARVSAKNPAGTSATVNGTFLVLPLSESVVGTFVGQIAASTTLNGNKGGRIDLTVTEAGAMTGKLSMGKEILSFKGLMKQTAGSNFTTGEATIVRKGKTTLQLTLAAVGAGFADSGDISGVIVDGENSTAFSAYRNIYNFSWRRNLAYVGKHNIGFTPTSTYSALTNIPKGTGYAVASLEYSGVVNVTGRLADGTTLTSSSFLGNRQQFLIYQSLYSNTGAFVGQGSLQYLGATTVNLFRVSGQFQWLKDAQTSASERTYKAGFGPLILDGVGMTYVAPTGTNIVMSLPNAAGNASLDFDQGGLDNSDTNPDVPAMRITTSTLASIGTEVGANPGNVKNLNISRTTGLFSGTFDLIDPPAAPKRTTSFYGLIIPQIPVTFVSDGSLNYEVPGSAAMGIGHFLLTQLPSTEPPVTTLKTSPILSGNVRLNPTPISITDQPDSQSVDPGVNVTFTVVASAPGGGALTYQWRKNEVSIANATSASYTVNSVSEASQGSYDVVITTAYSRVVSNPAVLNITDPVTNVVVSRTPSGNPVAVGTSVTFSATAQGSGPLTYRWRKNATDISGNAAAGATYTIPSVTLDDAGTYSVRITNSVTPAGVTSGGNSMTVAPPITTVIAQRTPSVESLSVGASVTFLVASVNGSSGPYTYQWRKGSENIPGATTSTYTINFLNPNDAGTYSVRVKNAATPDGVLSNDVPLIVSSIVSNVNASRNPSSEYMPIGSTVTFSVTTQGATPLNFQWKKGGVNIEGANQASYSINSITSNDAGNYTVLVSNSATPAGVLSNTVPLATQLPITNVTLTSTPNVSSFNVGDTVEFKANSNGAGPESYKWFKDENEILNQSGETLLLSGLGESDSGSYRVLVSNELTPSGISSQTVTILVTPP